MSGMPIYTGNTGRSSSPMKNIFAHHQKRYQVIIEVKTRLRQAAATAETHGSISGYSSVLVLLPVSDIEYQALLAKGIYHRRAGSISC